MAQNITLLGADYQDVPSVILPKTGGGQAQFVDITDTNITADKIVIGYQAYNAAGELLQGTFVPRLKTPIAYDYEMGYTSANKWVYQDSVNNHTDVYIVENEHQYVLKLGSVVGTRFRSAVIPTNPVGSLVDIVGTQVVNKTNPVAFDSVTFRADMDGYLVITKDNVGTTGLSSYLFDISTT